MSFRASRTRLAFFASPLLVLLAGSALHSATARADERTAERAVASSRLALDLGGVRYGLVSVRATEGAERGGVPTQHLLVTAQEIAPSLVTLVGTFSQGKPVKRDMRLSNGALIRKASDARLVSVKLPSLGSGGPADVELAFVAASVTTEPLLSAKEAPPLPVSVRIATFRVDVNGMNAIDARKLDAIVVTQKSNGVVATSEIAFEVAAGGAPPFAAWSKANASQAAPRAVRIEYVAGDGRAILRVELDRCTPGSVIPLGANGTTRVTLACASARAA